MPDSGKELRQCGNEMGSPPHLVQDELCGAMKAFPEIAARCWPEENLKVGDEMVVLVPS
jgi:hypothetical protein